MFLFIDSKEVTFNGNWWKIGRHFQRRVGGADCDIIKLADVIAMIVERHSPKPVLVSSLLAFLHDTRFSQPFSGCVRLQKAFGYVMSNTFIWMFILSLYTLYTIISSYFWKLVCDV